MTNAWVWVALVSTGLLAAACADETPQQCNCANATSSTTTATSSSGMAGSCDLGNNDCAACMATTCAQSVCKSQVATCTANADCGALESCLLTCADKPGDPTCPTKCGDQFMDGAMDLGNKLNCMICDKTACFVDCGGDASCNGAPGGGPPAGGGPPTGGSGGSGGSGGAGGS